MDCTRMMIAGIQPPSLSRARVTRASSARPRVVARIMQCNHSVRRRGQETWPERSGRRALSYWYVGMVVHVTPCAKLTRRESTRAARARMCRGEST